MKKFFAPETISVIILQRGALPPCAPPSAKMTARPNADKTETNWQESGVRRPMRVELGRLIQVASYWTVGMRKRLKLVYALAAQQRSHQIIFCVHGQLLHQKSSPPRS